MSSSLSKNILAGRVGAGAVHNNFLRSPLKTGPCGLIIGAMQPCDAGGAAAEARRSTMPRIFGASDWMRWLDHHAARLLGTTAAEFEAAFDAGTLPDVGAARDLSAVLPLIRRLRASDTPQRTTDPRPTELGPPSYGSRSTP